MTERGSIENPAVSDRGRSPWFEMSGGSVRITSSNINGLDDVLGLLHKMPHNADLAPQILAVARDLRVWARNKPDHIQGVAQVIAANLKVSADQARSPGPAFLRLLADRVADLERAIERQ